jgi:hypothetical protein
MTPRGKKLAVLVSAFCALFAIAGASSAVAQKPRAKAKVSTVNRTFQLPAGNVIAGLGEATPPCPSNRTLIGGGSRFTPGSPLAGTDIELVSSGPTGDAWKTVYDNNLATPQTVLSDALCIKNKLNVKGGEGGQVRPRVRQVTVPLLLPPQTTNSGIAQVDIACPRGYTVTNGGLAVVPGTPGTESNEITAFESGPEGNGWHVRYDNDSAVGANAEASVLCLKNKSKVRKGEDGKARARVQQVTQTVVLPPQATNSGVAEFDVACPGNTKLVGGGARFLPGTPAITDIELFESGPNGNSWHARFNNNTLLAQSALVSASCLRNNLKVK